MRTFDTVDELRGAVGEHLGHSRWRRVDQQMVTAFAEATGDRQWIHVDTVRAADGPFGTTIAHGFLALALLPELSAEIYTVTRLSMGINYGLNKVRFPSPLPTGRSVRAALTIASVQDAANGGVLVTADVTVEREGGERPWCVAQTVTLLYG